MTNGGPEPAMREGQSHSLKPPPPDPMLLAFRMGKRALGQTWPNPAVGAVVVDEARGVILGCGRTQPGGRPHAEVVALAQAGERARGNTLYVTLEPCSHHGKSPPCVDAIISAGIRRVVFGAPDPNPLVAGQGLTKLKTQRIEIAQSGLVEEATWLVIGHVLRMRENRPFVQLKLAVGADGRIPRGHGEPVWATGPQARARAHLFRARADAVLVGRGTVEADDPLLTCRLPGMARRSPVRVVLDSRASLPLSSNLAKTAGQTPVWLLHGQKAARERVVALRAQGVICHSCASEPDGRLNVQEVLRILCCNGITRLMVEGGPSVARAFLNAGLVDEVALFEGAQPVGRTGLLPFVDAGIARITDASGFELREDTTVGADRLRRYRNAAWLNYVHRDRY